MRHRGRELAILKTIGFTRGQVFATVASQATTFAAAAILAGLPLGIIAGRWAWRLVADQVGTPAAPVLPLLAIVAVGAGTILAANAVAAAPAWLASRVRPAVRLRAE